MTEEERALKELGGAGVIAALRWAAVSAHARAFSDFDPATGHNQTVLGTSAHTLLADRQDRVFRCERYIAPNPDEFVPHPDDDHQNLDVLLEGLTDRDQREMPAEIAGTVTRANLNHSPGWRHGSYQWLLNAYIYGEIDQIKWNQKSPTKRWVAALMGAHSADQYVIPEAFDEQIDFEAGFQTMADLLASDPELSTIRLVLAHSVDPHTGLSELYLGRPRLNTKGGPCWVWRANLGEGDGTVGARIQGPAPRPIDRDDVADAPVRLRPRIAEELPSRDIKGL